MKRLIYQVYHLHRLFLPSFLHNFRQYLSYITNLKYFHPTHRNVQARKYSIPWVPFHAVNENSFRSIDNYTVVRLTYIKHPYNDTPSSLFLHPIKCV